MAGEADEVAAVFSKFDKDGSGDIDVKELGKAIRQLGITVGTAVLRNLMKGYDADGSGALSVDEFRELVKELREYQAAHPPAPKVQPPEDISSVFRRFDADGSGDIDPKELVPALSELNLSADTAEAKQILSGFDGDNSGGLDIDEFSQLVDALRAFMKGQMAEEQQPPADGTGGSSEGKKSFAQSARGGMKSARVFVAALTKRVPKRNYLPTFRAKKTDAQEKQGDFQAYLAKQEEEAKKRKAKADAKARKRKKKGGDKGKEEEDFDDGERQALCMTIITIVLTLVLTLAEAFDLDVLVGFMMMPFISAMKWLAAEFDNQSLDPTIWAAKFGKASSTFAQTHPLGFVVVDFAIFAILVVYFLYEADLKRWWATRNMRAQGYDTLDEEKGGGGGGGARSGFLAKVATDPDALQQLVRQTTEDIEEHDLMVRLRGTMEPEVKAEMDEKRAALEESIQTYKGFLSAMETEQAEAVDLEELAREAAKAEAKKKREGGCTETTKMVVTVIKNAIAGIITIVLYFMDLITDYQVASRPTCSTPPPSRDPPFLWLPCP